MGATCSNCISNSTTTHHELELEHSAISKKLGQQSQNSISVSIPINLSDIIKLQSVLRGYIDRLQIKKIYQLHINSNSNFGRLSEGTIPVQPQDTPKSWQPNEQFPPNQNYPDYSTHATRQTEAKHGQFKYNQDFEDQYQRFYRDAIELDNKAIYIGEWNENNERHGRGIQMWVDGSKYEGYWRHDQANGRGRLIHSDGDIYEGEWLNDKAHGKGLYVHSDGAKYEGDWFEDKQHGQGVETWPDGACFQGVYQQGQKHGHGKFQWSDGSVYEGEFFDNNIHGQGIYRWKDGRVYEGSWKDNKMDGNGFFRWPDGRKYKGDYRNDKKHGFGVFEWPDGRKYQGLWADGKQNGKGVYISPQGSQRKGEWLNGKRLRWLDNDSQQVSQIFKYQNNEQVQKVHNPGQTPLKTCIAFAPQCIEVRR